VNPVIAVLLGWAFGDEAVSARTLAAMVIIVAAVAIITAARSAAPTSGPGPVLEEGIGD
jgi:drug/metabolite transporter (DMT)-like permease